MRVARPRRQLVAARKNSPCLTTRSYGHHHSAYTMVRSWTVALLVLLTGRRSFGISLQQSPQASHDDEATASTTEDVGATDIASIGCYYKGRSYDPGTLVSTDQPCLKCTCVTGSLVCHLQVCPEMPDPPPQGCVVVHKKTKCCAQLQCNYEQFGPVITKLFPSQTNSRSGPARMENSAIVTYDGLHKGCVVNGTVYAEGSAMDSSSLCEYCYCIKGRQQCVRPHCSLNIPGCAAVYKKHTCCPIRYKCSPRNPLIENTTNAPTTTEMASSLYSRFKDCRINGRLISLGEPVIGVARSSCETCFCINGQVRCDKVICPPIRAQISPNCGPVYTEGHCCPTSYDCADATAAAATAATTPGNSRETPLVSAAPTAPTTTATTTMTTAKTTTTTFPTTVPDDNVVRLDGSPPPTTTVILTETESTLSASVLNSKTTTADDPMESRHANPAGLVLDRFGGGLNVTEKSNSLLTDYDELTLPPSLPNLKIIPFVAADAVVDEPAPVYDSYQPVVERVYNVSDIAEEQPPPSLVINSFSPPVETEGGFVPKDSPAGTVYNVPNKIRVAPTRSQSTTVRVPDEPVTGHQPIGPGSCAANGKKYKHGELLTDPSACDICVCFNAKIVCQKNCPAVRVGCQRISDPDNSTCCGRIVCNEIENEHSTADEDRGPTGTTASTESPLTATDTRVSVIEHIVYSAPPTQRPVAASSAAAFIPSTAVASTAKPAASTAKPAASTVEPVRSTASVAVESTRRPTTATPTTASSATSKQTVAPLATSRPTTVPPATSKPPADEDYSFESMFSFLFSGDAASEQPSTSAPPSATTAAAVADNRVEHRTDDETDDKAAEPAQSGFASLVEQMFGTADPDTDAGPPVVFGTNHADVPPRPPGFEDRADVAPVVSERRDEAKPQNPDDRRRTESAQASGHKPRPAESQWRPNATVVPGVKPGRPPHQTVASEQMEVSGPAIKHQQQQQQQQKQQQEQQHAELKPNAVVEPLKIDAELQFNSLASALKISGCNIYGRMYRVGKIVPELSTPCLECMCTDVGVHCSQLKC